MSAQPGLAPRPARDGGRGNAYTRAVGPGRALALGVAIALLTAVAFPSTALGGAKEADARLNRELAALVSMNEAPPGVSALVQRGRKPKLHSFGRADVGAPAPIGLHDRMRIASVTKTFTGATLLRLVEKGRLGLGMTIGQVRPDLPSSWAPITLRQLLYHTSGLPNYTATPAFQEFFAMHPGDYISPQQLVDFAATEPVAFPPGAQYEYSNTDNIVMALMAEAATGRPFADLLLGLVLRPLRLTETELSDQVGLPRPFVHGYIFDEPGQPPIDVSEEFSPSGAWASGAIVSTPRDLNRFMRAWAGGRLLHKAHLRRAQTAFLPPFTGGEPPGPGQNRDGLTLYRYRTPCGVVLGHTGNFPGYTQFAAASPDGRRSAVVSANLALSPPLTGSQEVFRQLRRVFRRAACAALAG